MADYDIKQVTSWMVDNGYFMVHRGRYVVTEKFNREVRGVPEGLKKLANGLLVVVEKDKPKPEMTPEQWRDLYIKFIIDCNVPKYVSAGGGGVYEANKFSMAALKQFRHIITDEHVDLDRLIRTTKRYYADNRVMRMTITNYIITGAWRTDYMIDKGPEKDTSYELG